MGIFKKPTPLKLLALYMGAAVLGTSIGVLLGLFPWDHLWQFWR